MNLAKVKYFDFEIKLHRIDRVAGMTGFYDNVSLGLVPQCIYVAMFRDEFPALIIRRQWKKIANRNRSHGYCFRHSKRQLDFVYLLLEISALMETETTLQTTDPNSI
jgi:hypothetical protein